MTFSANRAKWRHFAGQFCDSDDVRLEEFLPTVVPTGPNLPGSVQPKWHPSLAEGSQIRTIQRWTDEEREQRLKIYALKQEEYEKKQAQLKRHELVQKENQIKCWEQKLEDERIVREKRRERLRNRISKQKRILALKDEMNREGGEKQSKWAKRKEFLKQYNSLGKNFAIRRPKKVRDESDTDSLSETEKPKRDKRRFRDLAIQTSDGDSTKAGAKGRRMKTGQKVKEKERDKDKAKEDDTLPEDIVVDGETGSTTFLTAVPEDTAGGKKSKRKNKPKSLAEIFPGLDRTPEGQAIKENVGKESQMPKKAALRKAQKRLLQKISKTVTTYRNQVQSQLERILFASELEYNDEEGRTRERMKPSITRMMVQLRQIKHGNVNLEKSLPASLVKTPA